MAYLLRAPKLQGRAKSPPDRVWSFPDGKVWAQFYRIGEGYLIRFPGLADFELSGEPIQVSCHPAPGTSDATAQHLYLNQIVPLVRSQQGEMVYHASAVEVGDAAVVFLGNSGRGKSTLAASFCAASHRFLTDDGLILKRNAQGGFDVLPSHPSLRLYGDSERATVGAGVARALPVQYTNKSRLLAGAELMFCDQPRPLLCAFFLGEGVADDISIAPIVGVEAHMAWVRHSFLLDVEHRPRLAAHFDDVADLAAQPINVSLDFPRRFEDLPAVRQRILDYVRGLAPVAGTS